MLTTDPMGEGLLKRLHADGLSQRDIGAMLNRSQRWVCSYLRRLELPPNGYRTAASRAKRAESARLAARLRKARDARIASVVDAIWPVIDGGSGNDGLGANGLGSDGYATFSALCRSGWPIHGLSDVRVLGSEYELRVRGPESVVSGLLVCPRSLEIKYRPIMLGRPTIVRDFLPSPDLTSSIVSVHGATDSASMGRWCRGRLDELGIVGRVVVGGRMVVRPRGRAIVGFSIKVFGLSDRQSAVLQSIGLGGRGRFGCGVFLPC